MDISVAQPIFCPVQLEEALATILIFTADCRMDTDRAEVFPHVATEHKLWL